MATLKTRTIIFFIFILLLSSTFNCSKDSTNPITPDDTGTKPVYEGSGTIDSKGGRVQITTPTSPIKGAFVDIPDGAVSSSVTVKILQAPPGDKAPTDEDAIIIKLEPKGLQLSKPAKIGLPFKSSVSNPSDLNAFYFNKDSLHIKEIPIDSIDISNRLIIAQTEHFSEFYSGKHAVFADIQLMNIGGKFGAKIKIFGKATDGRDNGLYGVPLSLDRIATLGIPSAGAALENDLSSLKFKLHSTFSLKLKEESFFVDGPKSLCQLFIKRESVFNNTANEKQIHSVWKNTVTKTFQTKWLTTQDLRQSSFSGIPLVFKFDDFTPNPDKKYYIEAKWALALHPSGDFWTRLTPIHEFTSYAKRKKISELPSLNFDTDNNYVDDSFQSLVENSPPSTVSIINPPNNTTGISTNVNLEWNSTDPEGGQLYYDIYLGTTNPPTSLISTNITTNVLTRTNLTPNTKYYWKVIAKDEFGAQNESAIVNFSTMGKPPTPTLSAPPNNAVNVSISPTLSWNASSTATSYTLQVSTNNSFSSFVYNKSGLTSTSQQISGLSTSTPYYWRVNATNVFGPSDWSNHWKFTTINLPPAEPSNPHPPNNAIDQPPDILVLSWDCSDPENNPLTFDIYLDIVSPPLFKLASSNTTKSYVVNNLGWKTNHYWKVVAKDDQGNTTSGPVWKFTTIGKKPESPTLSSPSNGATNISLPPTLSWNSSSGATSYTLQVAKDDQFTSSSLVYDQNVGNKTTQQVTGLSNSTPYYWRVNAENSNGISGWSAVWNFTTVSLTNNPPNAPTSPSPADGVTDQSTSPTLSWQCSDPDGDPLTYDVYFGTSDPPTATIATDQTATSISRSGLTSNTKYYWKIVAKDNKGASTTGNVWNFTTITAATAPTVTTTSITGITSTTATGGGNVTSQGSASVTARGVCWSTSQNPTTADSKTVDGSGTGSFTSSITGLTASTTYYVRAYAINSAGTSYGSQLSFVTTTGGTAPATPTLSFPTNGAINQSINPTLSWNASSGATSYILQVSNSTSFASPFYNQDVGNVTSKQISGLSVTTQYWWRVIAKNSVGESSPSGAWSFTTASSGGSSCAGTPTVTYAGKTYNTVQIGAQCWLKENLDVGTRINGSQNSGNNSIIEKYCYNDDPNNCDTYGGLYQWDEAMQYVTTERAKGICPTGWHIPTYAELQTLGTTVSNDGNALKAIGQGTGSGAGTNTSGFSALLAGYRYYGGYFYNLGNYAIFWSSTENEASGADALGLSLTNYGSNIYFHYYGKGYGYSVRCLKD